MTTKTFPLLNQIDSGVQSDSVDWNQNAFQTLLTSNLPITTIFHYAIDVGLRRLEHSLYETYWDATADALNDLSQFLFNPPIEQDVDGYLHEARCQLLMYSAIAMIKMNTIRRRSTHDAKMSCATICSLLLQQHQSYEMSNITNEYSACSRSMRSRYLKRIFIIVQWLPTLSKTQLDDLQSNYERYITIITDQLFSAVSLREKINGFIDNHLFQSQTGDDDLTSKDFVFIRRFPVLNEKIIHKHHDLMHMGLVNALSQLNHNLTRKLIFCIWTVCCMVETDRVSLGIFSSHLLREHFSLAPIDFEQKPIRSESLNERDIIVFLLLSAQQNVHIHGGDSTLHPYLLYSSSHLCTQHQKTWWQTAIEQTPWCDFIDHLATLRLDDDRIHQYPPKQILLNTARILFQQALTLYEQNASRTASSYEQYALQYLQVAKRDQNQQGLSDSLNNKTNTQGNKQDKLFFFYAQKLVYTEKNLAESLIDQCEKLARQCDELKILPEPEPPRTSSPTKEQQQQQDEVEKDIDISAVLSSVPIEQKHLEVDHPSVLDSTLFATPPANKSRDIDVQTLQDSPIPLIEVNNETALPTVVEMIFAHMNNVNQSINTFCVNNDAIQNDINTIRDRLVKLNRATSQMIFSNIKIVPTEIIVNLPPVSYSSHQI